MAGTSAVKEFREKYKFSVVKCLATQRAWDALNMEVALEKYGQSKVIQAIMEVRKELQKDGWYDVQSKSSLINLAEQFCSKFPKLRDAFPIEAIQGDILPFPNRLNAGGLGVFQHIQESWASKDGTPQRVKRARMSALKVSIPKKFKDNRVWI